MKNRTQPLPTSYTVINQLIKRNALKHKDLTNIKKTHFLTCVHNILDMIVNGIYIHNEKPHQINRHHQWNYQNAI